MLAAKSPFMVPVLGGMVAGWNSAQAQGFHLNFVLGTLIVLRNRDGKFIAMLPGDTERIGSATYDTTKKLGTPCGEAEVAQLSSLRASGPLH